MCPFWGSLGTSEVGRGISAQGVLSAWQGKETASSSRGKREATFSFCAQAGSGPFSLGGPLGVVFPVTLAQAAQVPALVWLT